MTWIEIEFHWVSVFICLFFLNHSPKIFHIIFPSIKECVPHLPQWWIQWLRNRKNANYVKWKKIFFYSFNTILISPTSLWCHARYHEQQELIVTSSATYACIWDVFKTVSEDSGVVMCRRHVDSIGRKYDIWVKIYIESLVMKSIIKGYSCMYQQKASLPVSCSK